MAKTISLIRLISVLGVTLALLILSGCGREAGESAVPTPLPPLLAETSVSEITADLQTMIPSLMTKARVPGLQIALIRDGRIAWRQSFGVRNAKTGEPVTDETLFEAASLTKPFFAYYAMKLVDQGVLSLDKPLVEYLPAAEVITILAHPLDEKGFRREWLEKVTARHVLSHSSGFPHGERGRPYPLLFEPGTKWKYSAEGYFFLQRIIEHLKGGPLEPLMQKDVLDPLGMTHSFMAWKADLEPVTSSGHGLLGRPEPARKRTPAHAAASLYTTAEDYSKFVCALLNGEGFRPETLKEMIAPQIDMDKPKGLGWSLGFGTQTDANGSALWQWGDDGIFRDYVIAYPERKSAVVYLTNSFYGLGICPDLVGHSLGGQAVGSVALNYLPYDSPLYRFVWDVEEKGPKAVKELKGLMRKNPGLFDRGWIGYFVECFRNADLMPQALAILEFDWERNPNSGSSALAIAEAYLTTGDRARARRYFEQALKATEEKVDSAAVEKRLAFIAALEMPTLADLSGEWSGTLWNQGQTDDLTMVLKSRDGGYEGTIADKLGLIPAGTELLGAVRTGDEFRHSIKIPLQGGMVVRVTMKIEGAAMRGRWLDAARGNSGPLEFVRTK